MISKYIDKLKEGESLQTDEAEQCLRVILESDLPDKQISELLIAFSEKGETADEILGFSRVLLARSKPVPLSSCVIDSCGTGGSGLNRFNVSTTAAFVLSAGGVPVVKHGNKGSKRPNGSFDLLEKLGCEFDFKDDRLEDIFKRTKVCFLFARTYHPVMKRECVPRCESRIEATRVWSAHSPSAQAASGNRRGFRADRRNRSKECGKPGLLQISRVF